MNVDGEALSEVANVFRRISDDMHEQLTKVDHMVTDVAGSSWTGAASDEFILSYLEWLQGARAAAEAFGLVGAGIVDAGESYEAAEQAIRASFLNADEVG